MRGEVGYRLVWNVDSNEVWTQSISFYSENISIAWNTVSARLQPQGCFFQNEFLGEVQFKKTLYKWTF